jgi:hypothetical protein
MNRPVIIRQVVVVNNKNLQVLNRSVYFCGMKTNNCDGNTHKIVLT